MGTVTVQGGAGTANTNVTTNAKQLSDGQTTGVLVNPAKDSAGNPSKLAFFGAAPVAAPTPAGYATLQTAGSTTALYTNSATTGGIGATQYTFGDLVAILKTFGLIIS